jgi:acyl-CoA synthetase (AMP-forming)/AMP-acid ligase II
MTIYRSARPDVVLPQLPLSAYVFEHADRWPDAPAFIEGPTGRIVSFRQLRDLIRRVSVGLAARGVRKGEVVALYAPNVPEYAAVLHGAVSIGVVATTANPMYTPSELRRQLDDSGARLLFTVPPLLAKAREAMVGTKVEAVIVIGDAAEGAIAFADFTAHDGEPPVVPIDLEHDIAVLPYSSGTTGLPKGVMLTHGNVVWNLAQGEFLELESPDGHTIGVLPFFHMYGQYMFLGLRPRAGRCTVTMPQFDLAAFVRLTSEHRVQHLYLVPPILLALARHPVTDQHDLSMLKLITVGAAPVSAAVVAEVTARLGVTVRQAFGATETSPAVAAGGATSATARPETAGMPVANCELRCVDPQTLQDVPAGERGEVWVRGPQVMKGYLNRPDATAECMTADGWLRMGDIGYIDADGYLHILDRLKEFIKVKAFQVAPAELESILLTHPAVADAAVIPKADEDAGEVPKAFVVVRAPVTAGELMSYVAERVSSYKRVRDVEFVDAIPKSPSGKILRRVLVAQERARSAS